MNRILSDTFMLGLFVALFLYILSLDNHKGMGNVEIIKSDDLEVGALRYLERQNTKIDSIQCLGDLLLEVGSKVDCIITIGKHHYKGVVSFQDPDEKGKQILLDWNICPIRLRFRIIYCCYIIFCYI